MCTEVERVGLMAQKKNPNKIPRTEADVRRAYGEGYYDGLHDLMDIMVYTIGSECEMSDDWLDFFHERFMKTMECFFHGELTSHDLRSTMYAEKGWEVEIK